LKIDIEVIKYLIQCGYDIFNSNSSFYNDRCSKYKSKNGNTDVTIEDRKKYFYESLCESNCYYNKFDITTYKVNCTCKPKKEIHTEKTNYTNFVVDSFKDIIKELIF